MDQAQLIEAIKINARTAIDTINRSVEAAASKVQTMGTQVDMEELDQMRITLEEFRYASEQLEAGANSLGRKIDKAV